MAIVIEIQDLRVVKQGRTLCEVHTLTIRQHEHAVIVGPNGSGKTTLLRVLAGLETDYSGACRVHAPPRGCIYVHQSPYFFRGTVLTNMTYALRTRGERRADCDERAMSWLRRLDLQAFANQSARQLSGGEKRKVALARALAARPSTLLLDEPFAELDPQGVAMAIDLINDLTDTTVLLTSPAEVSSALRARPIPL